MAQEVVVEPEERRPHQVIIMPGMAVQDISGISLVPITVREAAAAVSITVVAACTAAALEMVARVVEETGGMRRPVAVAPMAHLALDTGPAVVAPRARRAQQLVAAAATAPWSSTPQSAPRRVDDV